MKRLFQFRLHLCMALVLFTAFAAPALAHGYSADPGSGGPIPTSLHAQSDAMDRTSKAEKIDAPETNAELEAFRHAPSVQALARRFNVSTELMAKLLEDLNSAILIGAIIWFLFRMVPKVFRKRSETLQKQLFDARLATTEANEKLAVIEERLSKLGIEIEAIREQTERDAAADEKHLHESLEVEKQRIVASVEQEIEAAGAAARRDLKQYAASLAIDRAFTEIRLTDDDDRTLIRSFGKDLNGGRN